MKRGSLALSVLVLMLLAYAGLLSWSPARRAPVTETSESDPELETVEVAAPKPIAARKPAAAPTLDTDSTAAPKPAEPPDEKAWHPRGDPTGVFQQAFENEPRDALWADDKEREIRQVLSDPELPEDLIKSAACRKTVCRIELRWMRDGDQGMQRLNVLVGQNWAPTIGLEYPRDPGAKRALNVYIMRKDYTLEDVR